MAVIAFQGRLDMRRSFALRVHVIVATGADTQCLCMVHRAGRHRHPGYRSRLMAGVTDIGGINMTSGLATGNTAIVATDTGAYHLGVIHIGRRQWRPRCGCSLVASFAVIGGIYM